jgi:hypothetical protein
VSKGYVVGGKVVTSDVAQLPLLAYPPTRLALHRHADTLARLALASHQRRLDDGIKLVTV